MQVPEVKSAPAFSRRIPLARIDALVSAHLGPARVSGNAQPAVFNRQIAMYLGKQVGRWSTTVIGRFYNGRDHSTVCYAIQRIKALRTINPEVDQLLSKFEKVLQGLEPLAIDSLSIKPASIRLEKLNDDIFLDKLADRIAYRLMRLFGRVDSSGISLQQGEDNVVRTGHSPNITNQTRRKFQTVS